jgi:hypothetical protein
MNQLYKEAQHFPPFLSLRRKPELETKVFYLGPSTRFLLSHQGSLWSVSVTEWPSQHKSFLRNPWTSNSSLGFFLFWRISCSQQVQSLFQMRDNYTLSLPAFPIISSVHPNYIHLFLLFGGPGVWTQGLARTRQALQHLSHACSHFFALFIFQIGSHTLPSPNPGALDGDPPPYFSLVAGITDPCHQIKVV